MREINEKFRELFYRPFAFSSSLRRQIAHQESRLEVLELFIGYSIHEQKVILDEIRNLWNALAPRELTNSSKIRIGSESDGGYILASDYSETDVVVSLGVGTENGVDVQLASLGIKVHEFDHTVKREPKKHKNLFFHKKGIGLGEDLIPFNQILQISKVQGSAILLCDIEGAEFDTNAGFSEQGLLKFKQIVFELHGLESIVTNPQQNNIGKMVELFTKNHQVIHCHINNYAPVFQFGNMTWPSVLEISLVRKSDYEFGKRDLVSPQPLDQPNDPKSPDPKIRFPAFSTSD